MNLVNRWCNPNWDWERQPREGKASDVGHHWTSIVYGNFSNFVKTHVPATFCRLIHMFAVVHQIEKVGLQHWQVLGWNAHRIIVSKKQWVISQGGDLVQFLSMEINLEDLHIKCLNLSVCDVVLIVISVCMADDGIGTLSSMYGSWLSTWTPAGDRLMASWQGTLLWDHGCGQDCTSALLNAWSC